MVKTIEQVREQLTRISNVLDAISFCEKVSFKTYKKLKKVENSIFRLSYSIITDNEGYLVV